MTEKSQLRLSQTEERLLSHLLAKSGREMYGLELVREADVARGSVYVLLDRLEQKGLIESRQEEKEAHVPGMPRRLYKATGHGALVLQTWRKLRDLSARVPDLALLGGAS